MRTPRAKTYVPTETAEVARVLSAVLQGALAEQRTGSVDAAVIAFGLEYADDLNAAHALGADAFQQLLVDMLATSQAAVFSIVEAVANQYGDDPIELLTGLVRAYRVKGRAS